MTQSGDEFHDWCERWMSLARYTGPDVPAAESRIPAIVELWDEPIPAGWERPQDQRLLDPNSRYLRNHMHGRPTPGSEHELEHQLLCPTPATEVSVEPDGRLVDGINAVPLARDQGGHRAGNVEADMLLLIQYTDGQHELLLVEAKTTSNTAWYAVVENLRQLKLYQLSVTAQSIFTRRQPGLPETIPTTGLVLAPDEFYSARGAKRNAVAPARRLIQAMQTTHDINCRLATWDHGTQTISPAA